MSWGWGGPSFARERPETEELRRNWPGREVAGEGIPGRGIRTCKVLQA